MHKEMLDEEWLGVESETSEHGSTTTDSAQLLTTAVAMRDAFTTHCCLRDIATQNTYKDIDNTCICKYNRSHACVSVCSG